jgi:hypothetical protein
MYQLKSDALNHYTRSQILRYTCERSSSQLPSPRLNFLLTDKRYDMNTANAAVEQQSRISLPLRPQINPQASPPAFLRRYQLSAAHCNIFESELADLLAKRGGQWRFLLLSARRDTPQHALPRFQVPRIV